MKSYMKCTERCLFQMDVEAHIRSVMDEIMTSEAERNNLSEADMIEKLRNRGVVDEIMNHLHFSGSTQASRPATRILDVDDQVTHGAVKKGKRLMSWLQVNGENKQTKTRHRN